MIDNHMCLFVQKVSDNIEPLEEGFMDGGQGSPAILLTMLENAAIQMRFYGLTTPIHTE